MVNKKKVELAIYLSAFTASGSIIGGVYELLQTRQQHAIQLQTETEFISNDPQLLLLLSELEPVFKQLDNVALVRTYRAIDKLIGLRHVLETELVSSRNPIKDSAIAYYYNRRIKDSLQRFVGVLHATARHNCDYRDIIRVERLIRQIVKCVELHLCFIVRATRQDTGLMQK